MSETGAQMNDNESGLETATGAEALGITGDRLRSFIERIERLEEEKQALADDIKEVFAEAKGTGFDIKVMRKIIRMRKQDLNERKEEEALLETYMAAIGMI